MSQDDFDYEIGSRLRILLDGVEQRQAVEYDCEAGTVLRYVLSEDGHVQLNTKRDEALRETVHGVVTVEWRY